MVPVRDWILNLGWVKKRWDDPFLHYKMVFSIKLFTGVLMVSAIIAVLLVFFFPSFIPSGAPGGTHELADPLPAADTDSIPTELAGLPDSETGGEYLWHLPDGQVVGIYPPTGPCSDMTIGDVEYWDNIATLSEYDGSGKTCSFQVKMMSEKAVTARNGTPGRTVLYRGRPYILFDNVAFSSDFVSGTVNGQLVNNGYDAPDYCGTAYRHTDPPALQAACPVHMSGGGQD